MNARSLLHDVCIFFGVLVPTCSFDSHDEEGLLSLYSFLSSQHLNVFFFFLKSISATQLSAQTPYLDLFVKNYSIQMKVFVVHKLNDLSQLLKNLQMVIILS